MGIGGVCQLMTDMYIYSYVHTEWYGNMQVREESAKRQRNDLHTGTLQLHCG
jgi:hypothetical protein